MLCAVCKGEVDEASAVPFRRGVTHEKCAARLNPDGSVVGPSFYEILEREKPGSTTSPLFKKFLGYLAALKP
jgi:hypothetical protein